MAAAEVRKPALKHPPISPSPKPKTLVRQEDELTDEGARHHQRSREPDCRRYRSRLRAIERHPDHLARRHAAATPRADLAKPAAVDLPSEDKRRLAD